MDLLLLLGVFKVRWGFLLKDALWFGLVEDISSACRRGNDCSLLTYILPSTEKTGLFVVLSVYCSTCCCLGQVDNKMSCFRMWQVFSWVRKTIFSWCLSWLLGLWLIILYYSLASRASTSGGRWRQDMGYSPSSLTSFCQYRVPSYSQVGVPFFFAQDTDSYIQGWRNIPCH